jgi:catechol 2,3-dioxygenase-like lactoylglutathione lyase family enzyme
MLDRFDAIAVLPATDMERAKRFYKEKLGLVPDEDGEDGAWYRSGRSRLFLYPSSSSGIGAFTQAAWMVDDIENAVRLLRERGVEFEEYDLPGLKTVNGVVDLPSERAAWFRDSEGNMLSVGQRLP